MRVMTIVERTSGFSIYVKGRNQPVMPLMCRMLHTHLPSVFATHNQVYTP